MTIDTSRINDQCNCSASMYGAMAKANFTEIKSLLEGLDTADAARATVTTAELHVYADGTSGNDSNDGLTAATPKGTLAAVFGLIPDTLKHNVCVHLSGTFSAFPVLRVFTQLQNVILLVDGGDSTTVVDDNGGAHYTTVAGTGVSALVTGSAWAVDAHMCYFVKILSGPAAGQVRTVQGNTATTITPTTNFSVDPGVGATFDVVRPATTLDSSAADGGPLYLNSVGSGLDGGFVYVQRLYLSGSKAGICVSGPAAARIDGVVSNSTATIPIQTNGGVPALDDYVLDPTTFSSAGMLWAACTGVLQGSRCAFQNGHLTYTLNLVLVSKIPVYTHRAICILTKGFRTTKGVGMMGTAPLGSTMTVIARISNSSGYATTKISNSAGA